MLEKLLKRISQGGNLTAQSLAAEFGVSRALMEAMLADLARAGYLRAVERCGKDNCRSCGEASVCKVQGKVWVQTQKGSGE